MITKAAEHAAIAAAYVLDLASRVSASECPLTLLACLGAAALCAGCVTAGRLAHTPLNDPRICLEGGWQAGESDDERVVGDEADCLIRLDCPWKGGAPIGDRPLIVELDYRDTVSRPAELCIAPFWMEQPLHIGLFGGTGDWQLHTATFAVDPELIGAWDGQMALQVAGAGLAVQGVGIGPISDGAVERHRRRRWESLERYLAPAMARMTCLDPPAAIAADVGPVYREWGFIPFIQPADERLMPFAPPPRGRWGLHPIRMTAAGGQRESASVALFALADLGGVSLRVGDLAGPGGSRLSADRVQVDRVVYLPVGLAPPGQQSIKRGERARHYATFPHRLARAVAPMAVHAARNCQFFITVDVPAGTPAGDYRGIVSLSAAGKSQDCGLIVAVRPFDLDSLARDGFWAGCFTGWPVTRAELTDMLDHSLNAFMVFYSDFNFEMRNDGGRMVINWTRYNMFMDQLKAAGFTGPVVLALGNSGRGHYERHIGRVFGIEGLTEENSFIDTSNDRLNDLYVEGLRQMCANARSRGWPEVILIPYDEPTLHLLDAYKDRCALIRRHLPDARIYGVCMDKLELAEDVVDGCDLLVANGDYAAIGELARERGKELWWYGSGKVAAPDNPYSECRQNIGYEPWRARVTGRWWWAYHWVRGEPLDDLRSERWLATTAAYESFGPPVTAVAYESARAGLDDVRYLLTLERVSGERPGLAASRTAAAMLAELRGPSSAQFLDRLSRWLTGLGRAVDTSAASAAMNVLRESCAAMIEAIAEEAKGDKPDLPDFAEPAPVRVAPGEALRVRISETSGAGPAHVTVTLDGNALFDEDLAADAVATAAVPADAGHHELMWRVYRPHLQREPGLVEVVALSGDRELARTDCRAIPWDCAQSWRLRFLAEGN